MPLCRLIATELDSTYRDVQDRLPENSTVRFAENGDKTELILSLLNAIEETASLIVLWQRMADMLPRVDLPELILKIDARIHFAGTFTYSSEQSSRVSDWISASVQCWWLKPVTPVRSHLLRNDVAALERDRLTWTDSNYIRDETIREANAILVAAQNSVPLVNIWGDGEMASIKRTKNEIDS